MARYFDIHPANPQRRAIVQIADIVHAGGVIAYPTDSDRRESPPFRAEWESTSSNYAMT